MNRKLIIGSALGLVAGLVLMWALRSETGPPPVSIAYDEKLTLSQEGAASFTISNALTNALYGRIQERRQTNGVWFTMPEPSMIVCQLFGREKATHSHPVGGSTNVWRLDFHCYHDREQTWTMRTRFNLAESTSRRWPSLSRWISPIKLQTIHGPEMRGDKPVEKK